MAQARWFRGLILAMFVGLAFALPSPAFLSSAKAESPALLKAFKRFQELDEAGKPQAALPFAQKALRLAEKELGPNHKTTAILLFNLGDLYRELGDFAKAKQHLERGLTIWEKHYGPTHPSLDRFLVRLGYVSRFAADYTASEKYYLRYLKLVKGFSPPATAKVVAVLNNLAGLYRELGRYGEAEPLYLQSIDLLKKGLPKTARSLAIVRDNLAVLYREQGRYEAAERLHKQALAGLQANQSGHDLDVGHVFNNLGSLYLEQGRYVQAEAMLERAVAIFEKVYPPSNPRRGFAYDNLAGVKRHLGKYAEAESLYKKALDIIMTRLHRNHPDVALALNNLSMLYVDMRAFKKALPLQRRALAISRKVFGAEHANVAFQLANLGDLYRDLHRLKEAERYYRQSIEITQRVFGAEHPALGKRLAALGHLQLDQGRPAAALENFKRAAKIFTNRATTQQQQTAANAVQEMRRNRKLFEGLAIAAWQVAALQGQERRQHGQDTKDPKELSDIAFAAAQQAQHTAASAALGQMAARFGAGNDELAAIVRQRQDLSAQYQKADKALLKAVAQPPAKRNPKGEADLRNHLADIEQRISVIDARLAREFPNYAELANPAPLSLAQAQKLLQPGEAAIQFLFTERGGLAWLITADKTRWVELNLDRRAVKRRVAALRRGLDAYAGGVPTPWGGLPFDLAAAFELYQALFGPFEADLQGIKHLLFIPSGALTSLPPSVLITQAPDAERADFKVLRTAPWLIRKFAISVLPSASSLRALRVYARRNRLGREPFIGFGDPNLTGPKGSNEANNRAAVQITSRSGSGLAALYRGQIANVEMVRELYPLPDTADELRRIAASLGVDDERHVLLRDAAREASLKKLDLQKYKVVAFATHGLVAGEITGLAEPALVLTPPQIGTELDDGLLTASEVAQLKLDADWVLLSACNTASGDGTPGAEGLSGLARAFFYAGARSLLVSHWPVISYAAVDLTTGAFEAAQMALEKGSPIGRAESLRQSILAFIANPRRPSNAHPESWAPFVLIGEGALLSPPPPGKQ